MSHGSDASTSLADFQYRRTVPSSPAFLLRIVEGARVLLYRHNAGGAAELVPTRMDLFKYPGGLGWGYGGSGAVNLSYAMAAKASELDTEAPEEITRRAQLVLKHVVSLPSLDSDSEHDLSVEAIKALFT